MTKEKNEMKNKNEMTLQKVTCTNGCRHAINSRLAIMIYIDKVYLLVHTLPVTGTVVQQTV